MMEFVMSYFSHQKNGDDHYDPSPCAVDRKTIDLKYLL